MTKEILVHRIVPNIYSDNLEACKPFYIDFLGMEPVMDLGWIITFASPQNPATQISILKNDKRILTDNAAVFISIEVSDLEALHKKANEQKIEITYPLTTEAWGVRRFFVKDPNGATLNLLSHNA